jgi:XTP/dITP diphosphohydrolase
VKVLVATRNRGKLREGRALLEPAGIEVVGPDDLGLWETPDEARLELGDTFEANARAKAEYFARLARLPTVADDSGLEVLSLGGDPGVRSRRWAGATGAEADVDRANNAELLRRLAGAPEARRRARYRCVLAWLPSPHAPAQIFDGTCTGRILEQPRGDGGFGYDPLFFSDELGMTFGEATPEAKDRVSHRGRAYRNLLAALHPAGR